MVTIPVEIKKVEVLSYVMRIGEKMPLFSFWPRGREIIHRLIMRAAMAESVEEFRLYRTEADQLKSSIFNDGELKNDPSYLFPEL